MNFVRSVFWCLLEGSLKGIIFASVKYRIVFEAYRCGHSSCLECCGGGVEERYLNFLLCWLLNVTILSLSICSLEAY